MTSRSLILTIAFLLGGLHGSPSNATQWLGHEDDCLEYRHEVREASTNRRAPKDTASACSTTQSDPSSLLQASAIMMESDSTEATLLGLCCQLLI